MGFRDGKEIRKLEFKYVKQTEINQFFFSQ